MPRLVLVALAALAIVGSLGALAARGAGERVAVVELVPEATPPPPPPAIVVDVAGAVVRPGVVRLAAGARVLDALDAAGGITAEGDASYLNRAALLRDGDRVFVPRAGQVPPAALASGGDTLVDLNRASPKELESLPGVGPGIAARIVRSREQRAFAKPEELQTRGLVSAKVFEELRDLVVVR